MNILNRLFGSRRAKRLEDQGRASAVRGDFLSAKQHFREALQLAPDDLVLKDALDLTQEVLDNKIRRDVAVRLFTAAQFASKALHPEAIAETKAALSIDPSCARVHGTMATIYDTWGRPGDAETAIAEYEEAIRLNPNCARLHYDLGVSYSNRHQPREAIDAYLKAVEIDPKFAWAHNNLAFCYRDIGHRSGMTKHRDIALELGDKVDLRALNKPPRRRLLQRRIQLTKEFPLLDGPRLAWSVKCPIEGARQTIYTPNRTSIEGFDFNCTACGNKIDVSIVDDYAIVSTWFQPELR